MQQVSGHAVATGLTPPPATQTTTGPQQQPNATAFVFRKAVKQNAKLRLALSGPGGSGKTYTLLKLATALGGRIAAIGTLRRSGPPWPPAVPATRLAFSTTEVSVLTTTTKRKERYADSTDGKGLPLFRRARAARSRPLAWN